MTHSTTAPAGYSDLPPAQVSPTAPEWFHANQTAARVGSVEVSGCRVSYLEWGPTDGPATLLVHGGAAHAQWWAPLAPLVAPTGKVVAMDLSGHGASGRREVYSVQSWVEEVLTVARSTSQGPATVVAHSLGGIISAHVATAHGHEFDRMVMVDSPVWSSAPAPEGTLETATVREIQTYPDRRSARSRYRLVPAQPCLNEWYVDHVAYHSMHQVGAGWQWRFDPRIFANPTGDHRIARFEGSLTDAACPVGVVMGDRSYLTESARSTFATELADLPHRFVNDAAHHVMLDRPLGLVEQVRDLLADWT